MTPCRAREESEGDERERKRCAKRRAKSWTGINACAHLLGLEPHAARRVEGGDDRRVLLRPLRSHDRLAAPEDVGGVEDLLLLHTGGHVVIVHNHAWKADTAEQKNRRMSAKFSSCAAWACARQLFEQRRRRREQLLCRGLRAGVRRKKAHLTAAAAPPWRQSSARWSASRLAAWRRLEAGKVGSAACVGEPFVCSLW